MTSIHTPDEHVDAMRSAIDGLTATFHGATVARDAAIARAIRAALGSADPLALLAALVEDLAPQGTGAAAEPKRILCWKGGDPCPYTCEGIAAGRCALATAEPPATETGPTERVDMDLRYRYDRRVGVFTTHHEHDSDLPMVARQDDYAVSGLRVRITYTYAAADFVVAEDCAWVWAARLMERGAREVVCVGEEDGR